MAEYIVGIKIQATSNVAAIEAARKQLGLLNEKQLEVQRTAKASGGFLASMGQQLKTAFTSVLGPLASVVGIIMMIRKGAQGWLEEQRAFRGVAAAAEQIGVNGEEARLAVEKLSASLNALGFAEEDVAAAASRMLLITKSQAQALSATSLAADIAKKRNISLAEAQDFLAQVITASPRAFKRAIQDFGISARSHQEILDQLESRYRGYLGTVKGTEEEVNRAKRTWDEFWEGAGEGAIKAGVKFIEFFDTVGKTLKAFKDGDKDWGRFWMDYTNSAKEASDIVSETFKRAMKEAYNLDVDNMPQTFPSEQDFFAGIQGVGLEVVPGKDAMDAAAAAREKYNDALVKLAQAEIEAWKSSRDASDETVDAAAANFDKMKTLVKARLDLELRAINAREKAQLEEATPDQKAAISKTAEVDRVIVRRAANAEIVKAERELTDAILEEKVNRATAEAQIEQQQADAAIARNDARVARLQTEADNVFTSPERVLAIQAEITAINAETLALRLNNIEKQKQNALDLAKLNNATPDEKSAIAGKFGKEAKDANTAAAQVIAADANAMDARLKHLLSYGEAADAERKRQLAADLAAINERLAAVKAGSDEEKALLAAKNALQKTAAAEQVLAVTGQAAAVIGVLQGAFPESKALASASAFINMISGAVAALAPPPLGLGPVSGIPLAAATIAAGMANIAKINATDPKAGASGSAQSASEKAGFDSPRNDAVAWQAGYRGSARWADDMVAKYNSGIDRGWAERMAQLGAVDRRTVVNDNSRGSTVIQHLTYLWGPQTRGEAARASRIVDAGRRRSSRSRVGAGAATLGGA